VRILKQSESDATFRRVFFTLVDSATGLILQTGKVGVLGGFLTKKGATPVALSGTFTEVDNADQPGLYYYEATVSTPNELDTIGRLVFRFTATGCLPRTIITQVEAVHGANAVTITVEDDITSSPVPAVQVQIRNETETTLLATQETDSIGEVGFLLDDGTYKVRLRKLGAYTFSNPETLVVSGTTQDTYQGTIISPSAPPSADTCVLSGTTRDAQEQPTPVEVIAELVEARNFTDGGAQVIKGPVSVWSRDSDGYWEMVLTRSSSYRDASVVYSIRVGGVVMGEYLIPDQANVDLSALTPT
jgi:hypothetical protein